MAEVSFASKLVAEFTGTFLLVFTVGCNVLCQTQVWAGVSIACVLMVMIYAFGGISGGHFNPAVSVTLAITKMLGHQELNNQKDENTWANVGIYSAVQIAGGVLAGFLYFALFGHTFSLGPAKGFGLASAGICELLYTFMLTFVVLNVAISAERGNKYSGLAIGFVVVAGAYGAGAVSGGCFNPAVAIGIDLSSVHMGFGWCLVYVLFELLGAALAAVLFKVVRPTEFIQQEIYIGDGDTKTTVSALVSEFLGTFILVLTVGLNVLGKSPAGAYSIAASLMCMIYALGKVSGAHFNPAVTLAIFCSKLSADPWDGKKLGMYMGAQILGGIVAAFTYAGIYSGQTFPLGPGASYGWPQVAIAEIVFTFVLCLVVLCVAVAPGEFKTHNPDMFGLAIGACVTVGGFAIGSISGGSLNPAVSIAISTSDLLNGGLFYQSLIYSCLEFVGAAAAAGVVMSTHRLEETADEEKQKQ